MTKTLLLFAIPAALAGQSGGASQLAAGIEKYEQGRHDDAVRLLKAAQAPKLSDYVTYYLAASRAGAGDFAGAREDLARFWALPAPSPLEPKARLLEARVLVELKEPGDAVRRLLDSYAGLPQPDGDLAVATAYEATGDNPQAATYYQRVHYEFPASDAAERAGAALDSLRNRMGESYPPPMPGQMLERARKWMAARDYVRARAEFSTLLSRLGGADREMAAVGLGAADYHRNQTTAAFRYLQNLDVASPEAGAERLYYVAECARRLDDDVALGEALERLEKRHAQSRWRLKALVSTANRYLLTNDWDRYEPLYRACADSFPAAPEASYCHWKATWSAYLRRRKEAAGMMRDHLARFPSSVKASAALYFLGRLAEGAKDFSSAQAFYARILDRFPGYYYGHLARERLAQASVVRAAASPKATQFLSAIGLPGRGTPREYEATPETTRRIERAKLLAGAGLDRLAEIELRFGARTDAQAHLLAMELARSADSSYQGLRYMKSLVSDYFSMLPDEAPARFWELLFPLPWRGDLVRSASANALDPHIVAGLVRQESEFNPKALSRAKAYGLTQIVPSTGRSLARQAGIRRFNTSMLYQPATNLKLGTIYLRSMLDQWGGKWEQTLASYNAGKSRVVEWVTWGDFQEPAEFVETIPFSETRDYVQAVLRNATVYRRLYGDKLSAEVALPEEPVIRKVVAPARKVKRPARRRG